MIKRRNSINDQWSARRRQMLESPAYRVLSQRSITGRDRLTWRKDGVRLASSWIACREAVVKRRNSISGQFAPRRIQMLESPAYRALSRSGHMVISRIEIELAAHGGNDNGRLPVTVEDFVHYGMHRTSVAPAIREVEALGFIRVTERGCGGNAEHRSPNKFFLTYAQSRDSRRHPPTDEWRRIGTLEEANEIARAARANKSQWAVERGKRSWRKRQQKAKAGTENARSSMLNGSIEMQVSPVRDTSIPRSGEDTELLSISRSGDYHPVQG
jgi:hypothetical protein